MKKYFLKLTVFVLMVGLFSNCQEDKIMYDGTTALVAFVADRAELAVLETVVSKAKIAVEISTISSVNRTIDVTIDPKSTALATQYQIDAATLVIPANSYLGEIVVTGKFNGLVVGKSVQLILNLTSVGDATIEGNNKTFTLSIFKSCPLTDASKFNGNYKVDLDDWADYKIGDIVPVVYNAATNTKVFRIMSTNNTYISNPTTSSMDCTLDTATGLVTVASNQTFNYIGWQNVLVSGTGSVSPCTGDISLVLKFGTYTGNKFNLIKQ